jgi:hypothetical protein
VLSISCVKTFFGGGQKERGQDLEKKGKKKVKCVRTGKENESVFLN